MRKFLPLQGSNNFFKAVFYNRLIKKAKVLKLSQIQCLVLSKTGSFAVFNQTYSPILPASSSQLSQAHHHSFEFYGQPVFGQ